MHIYEGLFSSDWHNKSIFLLQSANAPADSAEGMKRLAEKGRANWVIHSLVLEFNLLMPAA